MCACTQQGSIDAEEPVARKPFTGEVGGESKDGVPERDLLKAELEATALEMPGTPAAEGFSTRPLTMTRFKQR